MSPIWTCPASIEAYYQETGRAGRDGQPAEAWMSYGMADVVQRRRMIDEGNAPDEVKRVERQAHRAARRLRNRRNAAARLSSPISANRMPATAATATPASSPVESWDGSEAAIKALACVYRTGQRFGAGHMSSMC
jgi:ATP-dependent DNA helicase RecQ